MPSYQDCSAVSPVCPVESTTYGYYPNLGANIFFTVFFAICGISQLAIGIYHRTWTFMAALAAGALLEMAGYIGRVLMHHNPWDSSAFKLQIVCLVLAPTFVAAGIYLTLKHIILALGPEHSRLNPRLFTWIFIGCDVGSLLLQAAGGGVAAAAGSTDKDMLLAGDNIIIAGIAFQVATMSVCGLLGLEFFFRHWRRGPGLSGEKTTVGKSVVLLIAGEIFAYITVLIRCIYRIPEMAGGWGNPLMQRENEFLVLDGMMIALAVVTLTILHPGFYFNSIRRGSKNRS
ncbi:RTA1 domain-containing protein [Aspergillus clavatus NRRL 1]|uniref:RTA1 domain protein, putative n=1 Tax=Aspergillus clavatus (strain ATCC 1007 / CBS 513.65 / DSM 816 / NCTC 3887 / NRRL 1 / QM 1276 / 107) TaxID=344612 RepID=A1CUN3_ASPCL|nr:RTA1 domain protein, putative [Aspergillus clavatus NRRL 1]EAW07020.1 RTA1 domain protein, putative [Aspergillus clavatus NRRL 1]